MEIQAISQSLQCYFDLMHDCDLDKFDRVFHPGCSLFTAQDGQLTIRPFAQYRAEMAKRTPPRSLGQPREDRVIAIDVLSPDIAFAKVGVRIFEKRFVDVLGLLKSGGQWMIVSKIYHHVGTAADGQ